MSDYFSENVRAIELDMPLFAARKTDPPTSHDAAKINRKGKKWRVLEALRLGPAGQTEIAARCGLVPHEVNKRLNDLRHARLAKCTGKEVRNAGGLLENEWRATDVG